MQPFFFFRETFSAPPSSFPSNLPGSQDFLLGMSPPIIWPIPHLIPSAETSLLPSWAHVIGFLRSFFSFPRLSDSVHRDTSFAMAFFSSVIWMPCDVTFPLSAARTMCLRWVAFYCSYLPSAGLPVFRFIVNFCSLRFCPFLPPPLRALYVIHCFSRYPPSGCSRHTLPKSSFPALQAYFFLVFPHRFFFSFSYSGFLTPFESGLTPPSSYRKVHGFPLP